MPRKSCSAWRASEEPYWTRKMRFVITSESAGTFISGVVQVETAQTSGGFVCAPPKDGGVPRRGHGSSLNDGFAYIFTGVDCVAMHCHFPFGIFTHVSVQRSFVSKGLPDASVPLPLKPPVAMAVFPKAVTFTS